MALASAGPYASLHLAADRQPCQHPTTQFFYDRMPFLLPNQQRQSTEGIYCTCLGIFSVLCVCRHFQSHPTLCHTASLFQMIAECVFLPGE